VGYRQGKNHDLLLAISVLMGLFRFATKTIPEIDENIFLTTNPHIKVTEKIIEDIPMVESPASEDMEIYTNEVIPKREDISSKIVKEDWDSIPEEVEIMAESKNKGKQGRLVTDPSPKLKAHMRKIIAQQNAKQEKDKKIQPNKSTEYAAKLAGLGKG